MYYEKNWLAEWRGFSKLGPIGEMQNAIFTRLVLTGIMVEGDTSKLGSVQDKVLNVRKSDVLDGKFKFHLAR